MPKQGTRSYICNSQTSYSTKQLQTIIKQFHTEILCLLSSVISSTQCISTFCAYLRAGFDVKKKEIMMLQHRVTKVPVRKKYYDLLLVSPEKHLKCKWHWIIFKCISVKHKTDEMLKRKQILNSICWTAHISPEVTSSIWYPYICDLWTAVGVQKWLFMKIHWGLRKPESNTSRTETANQAEKLAFFVLLIIIGWAYWFDVETVFGVCICIFFVRCVYKRIFFCLLRDCSLIVWDKEMYVCSGRAGRV